MAIEKHQSDTSKSTRQFSVTYVSGATIIVKPVPWAKLDDLHSLQSVILDKLFDSGGAVGELLRPTNEGFWDAVRKIAAMCPVVGQKDPGLDLEKIESIEDILRIFVTTTSEVAEDSGWLTSTSSRLEPSEVSRINGLNFFNLVVETAQRE